MVRLCCRGDDSDAESSEGDDPRKPIPEWARGRALMQQLATQVQTDPDEVFQQHRKTCSLDEVFGHSGKLGWLKTYNQLGSPACLQFDLFECMGASVHFAPFCIYPSV